MTVDIRAKVFCNLGPLISGNLSDEPLTIGQGLIRCRGQIVVNGLISPAIGSVVTFGYEKDGRVARLPRVVRVLGSFADPFRNTTTISVGDKLVLLANKKSHVAALPAPFPELAQIGQDITEEAGYPDAPPLPEDPQDTPSPVATKPKTRRVWTGACWGTEELPDEEKSNLDKRFPFNNGFRFETVVSSQKVTAAEEYAKVPLNDFATVKPSLSASFIALKCLAALGIKASNLPLTNKYNDGEFDLSEGYVSVLDKLLSSESLVGYLDETEALRIESLASPPQSGLVITENEIVDVAPLNIGTPPADQVRVLTSTKTNAEKKEITPPENRVPYASDFNLGFPRMVDSQFDIPKFLFASHGFDPDYFEQIYFYKDTTLEIESISAGNGCTITEHPYHITVNVNSDTNGGDADVGTITYSLTDGRATSNTATCYFLINKPKDPPDDAQLLPPVIEAPLVDKVSEFEEVRAASQLPKSDPPDQASAANEVAAEQVSASKRNWEFEESTGAKKTIYISYTDAETGEDMTAKYTFTPYSQTRSDYDDLDRKRESYSYRESIAAEVAGNLVKALLDAGYASDGGSTHVSWYTAETFSYFTEIRRSTEETTEQSEFGRAYEADKERQRQAWADAMQKNKEANEASPDAEKKTLPLSCPLDFKPPEDPSAGDTYNYDGMVFHFSPSTGWVSEYGDSGGGSPVDYAPVSTSNPAVIYAEDLVDTTRTTRESLISYMTSQSSRTYSPLIEIVGGLPLPYDEDFVYFPSNTNVLTDRTVIFYDVDWDAGKAKTTTHQWTIAANTASGQQYIKELCDRLADAPPNQRGGLLSTILSAATTLVYLGAEVQIRTDREYGVQQRPTIYDREWSKVLGDEKPDPEVFGDYTLIDRNATAPNQVITIEQNKSEDTSNDANQFPREEDAQERTITLTVTPPFTTGPTRTLSYDNSTAQFQAFYADSTAKQQALTYGRAVNAVARGNRYGMALQLGIDNVPSRALAWMYVKIGGVAAAYRANGVSYVFNASGLVCNVDALFWGGVGGTGVPWFPLAQGITVLPALPSVTTQTPVLGNSVETPEDFEASAPGDVWASLPYGEEPVYAAVLSPALLVPAVSEAIKCVALVRVLMSVGGYPYPLVLANRYPVLTVNLSITAPRVKLLDPEAGSATLGGQNAILATGRKLSASTGVLALSGQSSGYVLTRQIGTNAGTFTSSGQDAALVYQRNPLVTDVGAFTLSGEAVDLQYTQSGIAAEVGAFSLSGQNAGLLKSSVLSAAAGSLSLSGQDATVTAYQSATSLVYYSGTGSSLSVTGAGFEPGFVALKRRGFSGSHGWFDHVRGTTKYVLAGQTTAETTDANSLTSFDSDGFTVGTSSVFNQSGATGTWLAWCLPKGGAAANNTNGTVTTSVSVQSSVEYSVFTYTGVGSTNKTIGHGLSGTPDLVIIKRRGVTTAPYVGGPLIGDNLYYSLNSTSATATSSTSVYQGFSSTLISTGATLQQSGITYVGWAFKAKSGTSNVGEFTGGGSATNTVTLGYQPKVLILKNTSTTTSDWLLCYRPAGGTGYVNTVALNSNAAEATSTTIQFTSDGFSVDVGGPGNVSGGTTKALYWAML